MARTIDPKAKAKRQKIIAAVGAVILVALLVWRVPQVIALMNKKPPASSATTSVPAPAVGTPVPALPTPTPTGGTAVLVDTDGVPKPEAGQLVSFGRFVSKDPFAQQLGRTRGSGSNGGAAAKPHKPIKVNEPEVVPVSPPAPRPSPGATSSAQISVDGASSSVSVGAAFPVEDPIFKLVSVSKGSAKIAIEGGSYADGSSTLTLRKGRPVTLLNTADGSRYRIVLL